MSTDNATEIIRRSDIAAPSPAQAAASSGGDDWEAFFRWLNRFEGHFERISDLVERMRGVEAKIRGGAGQGQDQDQDQGQDQDQERARAEPKPVSALKVYQMVLGQITQIPPETTIGQAAEFLKANKPLVLTVLDQKLRELVE